jgi:hypothetical protein
MHGSAEKCPVARRHLEISRVNMRLIEVDRRTRVHGERAGNGCDPFKPDDVAAGRAYIKAYVEFIHFVERLYDSTMKAPQGHFEEGEAPSKHH